MDVSTAFLNAPLTEELYMTQPTGYVSPSFPHKVLRLKKSIYGLKQAPNAWHRTIDVTLRSFGFRPLPSEKCLYVARVTGHMIMVGLYVDDLLIASSSSLVITQFKQRISACFKMRDLGVCSKFLGLNVEQREDGIVVGASDYIESIFKAFDLDPMKVNSVETPFAPGMSLQSNLPGDPLIQPTEYRSLIGKLLYLANTARPDLAFSISQLSHYLQSPRQSHLMAAKRVLRYIAGTRELSIKYSPSITTNGPRKYLIYFNKYMSCFEKKKGYSDSDWAGEKDSRKSTGGYIFWFANGPITWKSKLQTATSQSTTEAELYALGEAGREMIWLKQIFEQLEIPVKRILYCDNQGTIAIVDHSTSLSKLKHIEIKHFFIRDHIEAKDFQVNQVQARSSFILLQNQTSDSPVESIVRHFKGNYLKLWRAFDSVVSNAISTIMNFKNELKMNKKAARTESKDIRCWVCGNTKHKSPECKIKTSLIKKGLLKEDKGNFYDPEGTVPK
ncbi:uncharacterized protein J8A68_003568 [[Candida] subhashii]|uniref:Reverse transcriptase Ty1/copia-type domain-containing protein n=1 Tax=[Candida] subhashii TaxID=561895 RepID=A0A8J5UY79_9ASCO|nr:uncharacterized protein J8A68_003568 [[Candida] subhashii]KAG7662884.1 hypothetical protein J8A68_003568 [[Candida] subhashii]